MYYPRILSEQVFDALTPGKVVLITGARRVGKTVLISRITERINEEVLMLNGEDFTIKEQLQGQRIEQYRSLLGEKSVLIIDEAQKIDNIGLIIKLMIDNIDGLKVILTGSSALDLGNRFGEALTGRKITFHLFPLSIQEFKEFENDLEIKDRFEERLIYGMYPEIWQTNDRMKRINYLKELANDYLFRDILQLENIRNASKLQDLLRLISFQIGKEVSNEELGRKLGMNTKTVSRYLDLLSKVFIIFRVQGFSRNLRKEITKNYRWYFYDNGIRNVFSANFNTIRLRQDIGQIWENFIIAERIKCLSYSRDYGNIYFWRTYDKQEIDLVEERDGYLHGYEIKWGKKNKKCPPAWSKAYPGASFKIIHPENYLEWVGGG
ncbi:ATP-binding protein [bacterium]|nr:ATP-binding protein [bacterium]